MPVGIVYEQLITLPNNILTSEPDSEYMKRLIR